MLTIPDIGPKRQAAMARAQDHRREQIGEGDARGQTASDQGVWCAIGRKDTGRDRLGAAQEIETRVLLGARIHLHSRSSKQCAKLAAHHRQHRARRQFARMRQTIGDLDILVASNEPKKILDAFVKLPMVSELMRRERRKQASFRTTAASRHARAGAGRWGSALQYFTGNKDHNVDVLRLRSSKVVAFRMGIQTVKGEKEILTRVKRTFTKSWECSGCRRRCAKQPARFALAQQKRLPRLIELRDLKATYKHIRPERWQLFNRTDGASS